ncbi:hypothetical protein DMB38_22080 [Streptomyces sp. WAC 06738]|uniref:DUF1707 and DUF4190 domain-containing protein n=1 Tax=Streptomyces sp. WAC 06738 TaxID=2203210 RepID=UPI000F6BB3CE|nr:DUF1707 and DUF4190 domain-containing protein [Streptomyces sp. WAC 06738]AZM50911.1 hypothetical protein DMB38_22080 [Streptomyces sp. WAC 06738]
MRAAHADRERTVDVLKAGFAEGRLTQPEYEQRMAQAYDAQTYGELHALVYDLPQGPAGIPTMPAVVPRTFQPVPVLPPPRRTNSSAVGAMVCGALVPATFGVTFIPAIVLGHKARAEIRRTGEQGEGMALAGLVIGYLTLSFVAFIALIVAAAAGSGG